MRAVIQGGFLFVVMVCGCADDPIQPVTSKAIYTGAEACATCHPIAYKEWHGSLHRRSMQVPSVETVRGDFTQNNTYTYGGMTSRMFVRDGTHFMETDGANGKREVYPVEYAIGDRDTQWYLTTLEGGRLQVLPVYWDVRGSIQWKGCLTTRRALRRAMSITGRILGGTGTFNVTIVTPARLRKITIQRRAPTRRSGQT